MVFGTWNVAFSLTRGLQRSLTQNTSVNLEKEKNYGDIWYGTNWINAVECLGTLIFSVYVVRVSMIFIYCAKEGILQFFVVFCLCVRLRVVYCDCACALVIQRHKRRTSLQSPPPALVVREHYTHYRWRKIARTRFKLSQRTALDVWVNSLIFTTRKKNC